MVRLRHEVLPRAEYLVGAHVRLYLVLGPYAAVVGNPLHPMLPEMTIWRYRRVGSVDSVRTETFRDHQSAAWTVQTVTN